MIRSGELDIEREDNVDVAEDMASEAKHSNEFISVLQELVH